MDAKEKLKTILKDSRIKNTIKKNPVPIRADSEYTKRLKIKYNLNGTLSQICYNPEYFATFSEKGKLLAIFHEYAHGTLFLEKKPHDHEAILNDPDYLKGIKDIFPNQTEDFYNKIKYEGCTDVNEFKQLPKNEQEEIYKLTRQYVYK